MANGKWKKVNGAAYLARAGNPFAIYHLPFTIRASADGGARLVQPEREVEHPFQLSGAGPQRRVLIGRVIADAEELVGDVDGGEHGGLQRVAMRTLPRKS